MPEWLGKLLGGSLGTMFKDIVGSFKADPTEIVKFQELIEQNKSVLDQKQLELGTKALDVEAQLNETAGRNIRADADSGDAWVRRARPSVVWMGNVVLMWNYIVAPLFGRPPVSFPDAFWWTWGTVVTGYVFARTADRIVGGAGGSISLPFGVKAQSQGD